MVVCTLHMAVVDAEQDNLFGPTDFVKVLCITPFILLLFLNTAGEEAPNFTENLNGCLSQCLHKYSTPSI